MKSKNEFKELYEDQIIELLQQMLRINTVNPPGNEEELAILLKEKFSKIGLKSNIKSIDKNRANIISKISGNKDKGALLFNGHLDTVPVGGVKWKYDPFSGEIADGNIYGRGSSDMKGGIASMIIAMQAILEEGIDLKGDLIFAGTAGEETDSIGAYNFLDEDGLEGVESIVISEPTSCEIAVAEKGALWVEVEVYGKTAHGAFPHKGMNAIKHMCSFLDELCKYEFKYVPHDLLGHPTINISTINGGIKTNVVPDICKVTIDVRAVPSMDHQDIIDDFKSIINYIKEDIPEFDASLKILNNRPAVETEKDHSFIKLGQSIMQEYMEKEGSLIGVNFYTDAAVFLPTTDLPCIIYGPGATDMAHQPNEMVSIEDLVEAAYFYYILIKKKLA